LVSPGKNIVSVKSLFSYRQQINSIKLLDDNESLKWETSGDKIDILLPPDSKTSLPGFVLKVELSIPPNQP
jgi:hypothetical protein